MCVRVCVCVRERERERERREKREEGSESERVEQKMRNICGGSEGRWMVNGGGGRIKEKERRKRVVRSGRCLLH